MFKSQSSVVPFALQEPKVTPIFCILSEPQTWSLALRENQRLGEFRKKCTEEKHGPRTERENKEGGHKCILRDFYSKRLLL